MRFTSFTQSSVKHYEVVAASLLKHNPGAGFQHIVSPGLDTSRLRNIVEERGGRYAFTEVNNPHFSRLNQQSSFWLKHEHLFCDNKFVGAGNRFILLDDDLLVRGDISPLSNAIGEALLASYGSHVGHKCFNIGVVSLLKMERNFRRTYFEAAWNFIAKGNFQLNNDELFFNDYFSGKIKNAGQEFNVQQRTDFGAPFQNVEDPKVVHFMGFEKPWNGSCGFGFSEFFTEYRVTAATLETAPINVMFGAHSAMDAFYAAIALYSVIKHSPREIRSHLFIPAWLEVQKEIKGLFSRIYEVDDEFFSGWNCGKYTTATFYRNVAPYLIEKDVKRLIYLDTDIMFRTDVACLADIDLCGNPYAAGAIADEWITPYHLVSKKMGKRHNVAPILVMDVEKMAQIPMGTLNNKAKEIAMFSSFPDEDLLLWTFGGNYLDLDVRRWHGNFCKGCVDTADWRVTHFVGNSKPWVNRVNPRSKFGFGLHFPEWFQNEREFKETVFLRGETPIFCGEAKSRYALDYHYNLNYSRTSKMKVREGRSILSSGRFLEEGVEFTPDFGEHADLLIRGLATFV